MQRPNQLPGSRSAASLFAVRSACCLAWLALAAASGCTSSPLSDKRLSLPGLSGSRPRPTASATASSLGEPRTGKESSTPRIDAERGRIDLMMAMAETHELHRRDHEAAKCYEEILAETPDQLAARHRLALCLDRLADHKRATEQFERCREQAPDNPDLLADMGYRCYLQGDLEAAEEHYRHGLQTHPRHERLSMNHGVLLAHAGREEEAIEAFIRGGCSRTQAIANVGHMHVLDDRLDEARPILLAAAEAPDASDRAKSTVQKLWPGETVQALHQTEAADSGKRKPEAQQADYQAADKTPEPRDIQTLGETPGDQP